MARHAVPLCATASTKRSTRVSRHAGRRMQTAGAVVRGPGSHVVVRNPPFRCDRRIGPRKLPAKSIDDETRGGAILRGAALWLPVWDADCRIEIGKH
ncbi:putative lipoprotein [Burkholderia thailandensis]|uniref:Lipoprotein n=1 Tax=Burkholderia thailandensis TaxID=57975 RepID=A0AAW9CNL1_BURTH|nr:putative lipoprotein [Burkholderia thailandensis]MDW9251947.1 putative lipoprotein [Burkholderia thailandensis]